MKKLVSNYTFNASAKTITLNDYTSVDLESLLLVTNVTDNIIIYNFASQGRGATISGNTLTLQYDTTSMSNTDDLQIFIDDGNVGASNATLSATNNLVNAINNMTELQRYEISQLIKRTESLAVVDTNQRQRVAVEVMPAVTVNGMPTVTVNGNNTNFKPVDNSNNAAYELNSTNTFARYVAVPDVWRSIELARQTYQQAIRSNLTF